MTADAVEAAVERIGRRDLELGRQAEVAAGWLMAGEGTGVLSQAGVQQFLWWYLPRKFPRERWLEVARGAALLLDELGFDRYTTIVRSEQTARVLAAWAESPRDGAKAARAAARASGVEPPDTELIQWGVVFGSEEAAARDAVERALEDAIVAGRLTSGATGWKRTAAQICDETMTTPSEAALGQTPLGLITTERVQTWITDARHPQHAAWCKQTANRLLGPVDPPADAAHVVAPLRWLLEQACDGAALTQSHYLVPRLVVEAIDRFDWWPFSRGPRSEADVPQISMLREAATRLRLVRRRGRQLTTTTTGRRLAGDTAELWRRFATTLGGTDDFHVTVAELMALRLLEEGAARGAYDRLAEDLTPILVERGWHTAGGPVDVDHVSHAVARRLFWWRLLGLLHEGTPRWDREHMRRDGDYITDLNPAGRSTALAYLRHRALRPRTGPYDS